MILAGRLCTFPEVGCVRSLCQEDTAIYDNVPILISIDFTLCLPTWDPKQSAIQIEDGDPRLRLVVQVIAVQLLASCFSVPQEVNTLTLPSGWYRQNHQNGTASRPISSLRQHTRWSHSPAFGYHARNNSAESLCSTAEYETSREAYLAEHVSRNRLLKQTRRLGKKLRTRRRDGCVDHRGGSLVGHSSFPLHPRKGFKSIIKSASSQRLAAKGYRSQPGLPGQDQPGRGTWAMALQNGGHGKRGLALESTIRSEEHPVFIQPIKKYVLRRCRALCARNRHSSPTSASGECAGRSNSLRSALGRSSKRKLGYHRIASSMSHSSNAVARTDILSRFGESAITLPTPHENDEIHGDTEEPSLYSLSQEPQESLGTLEAGQTRHRASTSGTTIYHPPLIAQASPDTRKLDGDSSSSTLTAGGRPFLFL